MDEFIGVLEVLNRSYGKTERNREYFTVQLRGQSAIEPMGVQELALDVLQLDSGEWSPVHRGAYWKGEEPLRWEKE